MRKQYKLEIEEDKTIKTKVSKEETIWPEENTLSMKVTKKFVNTCRGKYFGLQRAGHLTLVYLSRT